MLVSQEKQILNILLTKGVIDNFYCIDTMHDKQTKNTFYYLFGQRKAKK